MTTIYVLLKTIIKKNKNKNIIQHKYVRVVIIKLISIE